MKKNFYVSAVLLTVFFMSGSMLFAQDESKASEDSLPGFQLLLSGDLGYAGNSDVKNFTSDQGRNTADQYNAFAAANSAAGGFKVDETTSPNMIYGGDIEMRFFPGSFGFGIGTGVHCADSTSKISSPNWSDKVEYKTSFTVVPVVATLYYVQPINENSFAAFGAGAGYYFGMLDGELSSSDTIPDDIDVYEPLSDSSTIGYHIKAEYNLFFKPFCLTAGVMGRYVQFSEFEDDNITLKLDAGLTGVSVYLAAGIAI